MNGELAKKIEVSRRNRVETFFVPHTERFIPHHVLPQLKRSLRSIPLAKQASDRPHRSPSSVVTFLLIPPVWLFLLVWRAARKWEDCL
jgi:hypothetical protein